DTLIRGGVDIVATANNHSGDYGPDALVEQGEWLDAAGIGHAGSGRTREEAFRPVFRRAGGLDVAFFALDATQKSFA
ncbi:CapA family protein, partial [Flagellimonas flava]|uniref:CapA family protein n=2 Tax=Pseudomonadati TaxID=3379134 RepID=UPI003D65864E